MVEDAPDKKVSYIHKVRVEGEATEGACDSFAPRHCKVVGGVVIKEPVA